MLQGHTVLIAHHLQCRIAARWIGICIWHILLLCTLPHHTLQVLTDRFAPSDGWGQPCANLDGYCGGTFTGLVKRMSYIQDLGFDAVWISPVMMQGADQMGASGYHGYWPADHYKVNPAFGSKEDLQALMDTAHKKGELALLPQSSCHGPGPLMVSRAAHADECTAVCAAV